MTPGIETKSTGPRTAEGKAVSALNGQTHGFTSIRISPKNAKGQEILKIRREGLAASLKPANFLEWELVDAMASAATRKDLIELAQDQMEAEGQAGTKLYDNLHRYWKDAERAFHRSLTALQSLRRDTARETRDQFRDRLAAATTRKEITDSAYAREKGLMGTGRSLFDGPNSRQRFDDHVEELLKDLRSPVSRPNPEKPAAA